MKWQVHQRDCGTTRRAFVDSNFLELFNTHSGFRVSQVTSNHNHNVRDEVIPFHHVSFKLFVMSHVFLLCTEMPTLDRRALPAFNLKCFIQRKCKYNIFMKHMEQSIN